MGPVVHNNHSPSHVSSSSHALSNRSVCPILFISYPPHFNVLALQNHTLQLENEEIPILRDSLEEMKYLESKVVSKF